MRTDTVIVTEPTCAVNASLGGHEACPGEPCPFWQGGACVVAGLHADLGTTAGLAELLLRIRDELGERSPPSYGLLPPGLR